MENTESEARPFSYLERNLFSLSWRCTEFEGHLLHTSLDASGSGLGFSSPSFPHQHRSLWKSHCPPWGHVPILRDPFLNILDFFRGGTPSQPSPETGELSWPSGSPGRWCGNFGSPFSYLLSVAHRQKPGWAEHCLRRVDGLGVVPKCLLASEFSGNFSK